MGPPVSAAFDAEGHPTNAGLGFARKLGVDFDAIQKTDTPKGKYLSYQRHIRGKATVDVLPGVLGTGAARSAVSQGRCTGTRRSTTRRASSRSAVRSAGCCILYGGRVVPFTIARQALASSPRVQDVTTGAVTYGHRFLATSGRAGRAIKVRSFDEYRKKLAENFVILSRIDRRDRIMRDLEAQARQHRRARHAASAPAGAGAARGSAGPGRVSGGRERRLQCRVPDAAGRSADDDADSSSAFLSRGVGNRRADAGVSGRHEHAVGQRSRASRPTPSAW